MQEQAVQNFEFNKKLPTQVLKRSKELPIDAENLYWKFEKVMKSALGRNLNRGRQATQYKSLLRDSL